MHEAVVQFRLESLFSSDMPRSHFHDPQRQEQGHCHVQANHDPIASSLVHRSLIGLHDAASRREARSVYWIIQTDESMQVNDEEKSEYIALAAY
jgi:hypothetical protein